MNRVTLSLMMSLFLSHQVATAQSATSHQSGDIAVETSIGLAAGYGLFGLAAHYAISESTDLGVSGGVDLYNTHLGIRATTYLDAEKWAPLGYFAVSRSQFASEESWYASAGVGIEYRSSFGLYWQGNAGFAAYVSGHACDGNGPGFFEARPLTIGYRF